MSAIATTPTRPARWKARLTVSPAVKHRYRRCSLRRRRPRSLGMRHRLWKKRRKRMAASSPHRSKQRRRPRKRSKPPHRLQQLRRARAESVFCRSSARRSRQSRRSRSSSAPRRAARGSRSKLHRQNQRPYPQGIFFSAQRRRQDDGRLCLGHTRRQRQSPAPHPGTGLRCKDRGRPLERRPGRNDGGDRQPDDRRLCRMASVDRGIAPPLGLRLPAFSDFRPTGPESPSS